MKASKLLFLLVFMFLFSSSYGLAAAQEPSPSDSDSDLDSDYAPLMNKAEDQGSVMVIVGLDLPNGFQTEGQLDQRAAQAQQAAIEQTQQNLLDSLSNNDVEAYAIYPTIPYMALNVDQAGLRALADSPLVTTLQEDIPVPPTLGGSMGIIGAPAVWEAGHEGTNQTVVILDTGIDANHSFFGQRVVTEACFSNAGGDGGGVTLCPNGEISQRGPGAADAKVSACNGGELCNHGTHVAGIAAGKGQNFDGVARGANIVAIQVFTRFEGATCGGSSCVLSYVSDQLNALQHIHTTLLTGHNVASVNMSLGGGNFTDQSECDSSNNALKSAIDQLRSMNVPTIISAGNAGLTNGIAAPACISSAIAVGSTENNDTISSFSNMHEMVDLLAPGSSINSSFVGGGFSQLSGTSMSAPHVAGAWAILKEIDPEAKVDDIFGVLEQTSLLVTDTRTTEPISKPRIKLQLAALIIEGEGQIATAVTLNQLNAHPAPLHLPPNLLLLLIAGAALIISRR